MKNLLTSIILLLLFSGSLMAQSIYFRAGTGYGLPIATTSIGTNTSRTITSTTTSGSTKAVNASYGSGLDFNFAVGYKLNQNFMFDFNFQYLMGAKYKTSDTYNNINGSFNENDFDNTTTSARGIFINPSVIFSAGFGKAAPYGRIGFITGSPTVTGENSYYNNGDGVTSHQTKWEYTKGMALGYQSAIGMNWKLSEKIDLFTELNFVAMSYYPGIYKLTESIYNGTDNLINYSVSQKETTFKKSFDPTKVNTDPTKPYIAVKESFPFSSLSFQAGIRFVVWKKAE